MNINNNLNLLELPKEILPNILQYVDTTSLRVCKTFYTILFPSFVENCRNSFWLKDRLEVIEGNSSLSDKEKIKALYQGIIKNILYFDINYEKIKQALFLTPKAFSIEQLNQSESAIEEYELVKLFEVLARQHPVIQSAFKEMKGKIKKMVIAPCPIIIKNQAVVQEIRTCAQEIRTWLDQNKEELAKIKTLNHVNFFTRLPREIGKFNHLQCLDLGENRLTGLPKEIGQLTQLVRLGLSRNRLKNLPETIGQLTQLQVLTVNHNCLKNLPLSFKQLTHLKYFNFRDNELTKENIPEEIRNLPEIYFCS